jgi:mannose-1-phosphate guanylyltransferase
VWISSLASVDRVQPVREHKVSDIDLESVKTVILCGGNGVRLRPLSLYIQKCMIPIHVSEKPLLEHILSLLRFHGLRDITCLIGYKGEQIMNYFGNGDRFDMTIRYTKDREDVKGSGWALYNAFEKQNISKEDTVLIYYGDVLSNVNISDLLLQHKSTGAAATLVTSPSYHLPVGVVQTENGRVTSVIEKPHLQIQVGIGLMVVEGFTLQLLESLCNCINNVDIMTSFIPRLMSHSYVGAYSTDAFWYDVGSLEKYEKLGQLPLEKLLTHSISVAQTQTI